MRTTLFLLYAISCCWLVSATLSKTDVKKSHKAEAEVSHFRALPWNGSELCFVSTPRSLYLLSGLSPDLPEFSRFRKRPFIHTCLVLSKWWWSNWNLFCLTSLIQTSPAELSVLERGLIVSDPQWKDIVKEEKRYCAHIKRTFQGQVLGYVTPVSLKSSHQHICTLPWLLTLSPQH